MPKLRHGVSVHLTDSNGQSFNVKHDQRETLTAADPETDLFRWTVPSASEADLSLSTVTAGGVLLLTNLDASNFITYGVKDGGSMVALCTLQPSETHKVRLASGATLRAQADTADVEVQVAACDA